MTDQALENDAKVEGQEGEGAAPAAKKWSGKRIVLFIVLPLLVVLGGGAAGVYFSGILGGGDKPADEAQKEAEPAHTAIFFDIPDLLVNLNTNGKRTSFLKLKVALELGKPEDQKILEQVLPRVVDNFQVYLREMRAEDLRGSAGLYRLREDLLARAQIAAQPADVRDVLFKEMLIQ
ncbi:MAG TPA: flagellar basal body-associated FliL family protein [Alphaproteobacteria bacterium]|jgi:flagellar FliL protein|nr:flagellar basal body-associated FliL family protein [Alphaproteobacteria bacterium]